jgi:hypothetical protein
LHFFFFFFSPFRNFLLFSQAPRKDKPVPLDPEFRSLQRPDDKKKAEARELRLKQELGLIEYHDLASCPTVNVVR